MKIVNVHEAKTTLSALLAAVERGEDVIIARNGVEVALLTRVAPRRRKPGAWGDLPGWEGFRYDPAILGPMTDDEMREEGWP
jgi:prevent-host-death family protein